MNEATPLTKAAVRRLTIATCVAIPLAVAGIVWPKLGLPSALITLITLASGALRAPRVKPWAMIAGAVTVVALIRFVVAEAVPGVVQGGNIAASNSAVSRLRQIVFAQDVMRQRAFVDPDGDRIGSAGLLGELTSSVPLRGMRALQPPLLARGFGPFHDTKMGPAAQSGAYLFMVCLPAKAGGFLAQPGMAVDEESAERRFLAYAWPMGSRGPKEIYAVDQHERILVSPNQHVKELKFVGPFHAPSCDAAVTDESFSAWRGKAPRATLPGDTP